MIGRFLENWPRNPLLIVVFTIVGVTIRYCFFFCVLSILGKRPKKFEKYSDGILQITYNLLLTLMIVLGIFIWMISDMIS